MGHAARDLPPRLASEARQDLATVVELTDGASGRECSVELDDGSRRSAAIAASCLLEPSERDRVLIVQQGAEAYVLSVLRRDDDGPARLRTEGDLIIEAGGRLKLAAREGVDIVSAAALRLVSATLKARATEGEVTFDRVTVSSHESMVSSGLAKMVADRLDSFVGRLSQHAKRSYRTVEEADVLHAERIDYRTTEEVSIRGKHTFVHAADLMKVTGEQIHMG